VGQWVCGIARDAFSAVAVRSSSCTGACDHVVCKSITCLIRATTTPTIHGDAVVFVTEDDLWRFRDGCRAERLTAGVGQVGSPRFSPNGATIAFVGREEGPTEDLHHAGGGGEVLRLTYQARRAAT